MDKFFPSRPKSNPKVYAYSLDAQKRKGLLKVGYTTHTAQERIHKQLGIIGLDYIIELEEEAMRNDGTTFTDHDVHRLLKKKGVRNVDGEWYECDVNMVRNAIHAIREGDKSIDSRTLDFTMRPEQQHAVDKTIEYFKSYKAEKANKNKSPHFLWNCKMRFGKTFTAYQLAKRMGWKKVLVLTFKPAVHSAWEEDLMFHKDFEGWQFISNQEDTLNYEDTNKNHPIVCFGSFQDFLGKTDGRTKEKNKWVHQIDWDIAIFDEYHYGAWNENSSNLFSKKAKDVRFQAGLPKYKDLVNAEGESEIREAFGEGFFDFDIDTVKINSKNFLLLSGTPFRAISSGEFIEEQIFNWTYSDEQKAKEEWEGENNPYESLPRMVMMTYQLPDSIIDIAKGGEYDEFDLNLFFKAEGEGDDATFIYKDEVQKWLDLIRGSYAVTSEDNLKQGAKKPPLPFAHAPLLPVLTHTFWFLPRVASCYAMKNLMMERQNTYYQGFNIVVAAGTQAGVGVEALPPVLDAMHQPLESKSITLSCGKLTTGVSVKPWTGIFMLRNSSSPETYFQAAFRVQTPWTIKNPTGKNPNEEQIVKRECYVFDFAPTRALRQISTYSCELNVEESNPEKNVAEFIKFLPVLAYDGSSMKQIDAAGILDIAMSGTTATLLARRWESALLVNVRNEVLERLLKNEKALNALMSIEGFRSLNQDIETIINKSEAVKKAKKELNDEELTREKKKELSDEEKEYKSLRKQIQEKLIKFATRIPIFMYLTDYREHALVDVINELEPDLFKKVTGLTKEDFQLLVSLGLFNESKMNDAVYKFKRYEDASLSYSGINKHEGKDVGLWQTSISQEDYQRTFENESLN